MRFCVFVATLLAGCARPLAHERSVPARLDLFPADADVWSNSIAVSGSVEGAWRAQSCELLGGAERVVLDPQAGRFKATLPLAPGVNRVFVRCVDVARERELRSQLRTYTARIPDEPRAVVTTEVQGRGVVLDGGGSTRGWFSHAELEKYSWYRVGAFTQSEYVASGPRLEVPAPARDGEILYQLEVSDRWGRSDRAQVALESRGGVLRQKRGGRGFGDRVLYGVVPPLFGSPPLQAVRRRLPELATLGVGALWLSPVFATPTGEYGYAVTDYFRVRPDYGSAEDLRALVDDAHRLGLRVLLDWVPNHTSAQHAYFEQAEALGTASHYYGYYSRDATGRATHYFDWAHLPNLSYANVEVSAWMTAASLHWIRDFGIDGYRVDAAWGLRERSPLFLAAWLAELRRRRADFLVIAEASALDPFYVNTGFDAAYDWTPELGHWAWEQVFSDASHIAERLDEALRQNFSRSPHPERTLRFLNNNDTGPRFVTRHGVALTSTATVLLLTLPGVPCLFSFDEIGAEFEPYAGLAPFEGPAHPELAALHQRLLRLRNELPSLRGAGFLALPASADGDVYAYLRLDRASAGFALVVLNFSAAPRSVELELPEAVLGRSPLRGHDALAPEHRVLFQRRSQVNLAGYGYSVLVPD